MPINIYNQETGEQIDWLCDGVWDLPTQIKVLETWLEQNKKKLIPNKYVADIGFEIREEASSGGAVLNAKSMDLMGELGMNLFFSEYPSN